MTIRYDPLLTVTIVLLKKSIIFILYTIKIIQILINPSQLQSLTNYRNNMHITENETTFLCTDKSTYACSASLATHLPSDPIQVSLTLRGQSTTAVSTNILKHLKITVVVKSPPQNHIVSAFTLLTHWDPSPPS